MPLSRRTILTSSIASAFILPITGVFSSTAAQGDANAAARIFIQQAGDDLAKAVNSGRPDADKRRDLQTIVDRVVDVDAFATFALGRFWGTATPQQQQQFLTLFHTVLMNNLSSKLNQYAGVSFVAGRAAARGDDVVVDSVVSWPNFQPYDVQWIVGHPGRAPKIIDVIAVGTSMRLTQRNDYAGYLSRNAYNLDALLAAMRKQVGG